MGNTAAKGGSNRYVIASCLPSVCLFTECVGRLANLVVLVKQVSQELVTGFAQLHAAAWLETKPAIHTYNQSINQSINVSIILSNNQGIQCINHSINQVSINQCKSEAAVY